MPIGVPKVPFRLPGEPAAQWVDLYNRLYRERVLFLCQELNDELANQLIGIMLYLNAEEKNQGVFIYINSPGGSVTCGIGVYDAMHYINTDVTTICVGTAASMASFILAGGTYGKRIALQNSRIMIHQPEGGSQGQASEVISEAEEVTRIRDQVTQIYAQRTGQPLARISRDMDRDQFLSGEEAKEYGLVDAVSSGDLYASFEDSNLQSSSNGAHKNGAPNGFESPTNFPYSKRFSTKTDFPQQYFD